MVRYFSSTLTACALAGAVSVFAQEPAPAQPEQPQAPLETLIGCVAEARTTDGGTTYVLNKAEGGTASMYILAGPMQSEFSTRINKKVEVIGPVQQPTAPSERDASGKPTVLRPPSVRVEAVKDIAETCQ